MTRISSGRTLSSDLSRLFRAACAYYSPPGGKAIVHHADKYSWEMSSARRSFLFRPTLIFQFPLGSVAGLFAGWLFHILPLGRTSIRIGVVVLATAALIAGVWALYQSYFEHRYNDQLLQQRCTRGFWLDEDDEPLSSPPHVSR